MVHEPETLHIVGDDLLDTAIESLALRAQHFPFQVPPVRGQPQVLTS